MQTNEARQSDDWNDLVYSMVYGDTILFCSGCEKALVLNTKGFAMRGIQEPDGETVLKGPREGFTEGILRNLSMLRRKLRVSELKQEYLTLGHSEQNGVRTVLYRRCCRPEGIGRGPEQAQNC